MCVSGPRPEQTAGWEPDHREAGLIDHFGGSSFINSPHPSDSPGICRRGEPGRGEPGREAEMSQGLERGVGGDGGWTERWRRGGAGEKIGRAHV